VIYMKENKRGFFFKTLHLFIVICHWHIPIGSRPKCTVFWNAIRTVVVLCNATEAVPRGCTFPPLWVTVSNCVPWALTKSTKHVYRTAMALYSLPLSSGAVLLSVIYNILLYYTTEICIAPSLQANQKRYIHVDLIIVDLQPRWP